MTKSPKKKLSRRPDGLPEFRLPPLNELVLSIQFARIPLRNIDVGGIWQLFRKQYPNVEEQQSLQPQFEKYGLPPSQPEGPQILFSQTPNVLRYWFVADDGNELLQVQPDRLVHNWRQNIPGAEYPRYEQLRTHFLGEVRKIESFLDSQKLGQIKPNQCEVSYINHITLPHEVEPDDKFDQIFTVWREEYSDDYLSRIERGQFAMSYVIPSDDQGEPFGRLHVQAQSAFIRTTSTRIVQFTLTVRGRPKEDTVESAFEWLDKGRSVVVRAFTSLTTPEMHEVWGRVDG